jgi:prepilin-type N-terminal cleavage/methylation domain-containing protein
MAIKNKQAGFTLIEMLMVVAIFAVITTILMFNYSDFSTSAAVRNLAEDIGLSVRKAQSYATSVRSLAGTNAIMSDMFPAYGASFSVNPTGNKYDPTATSFILFADVAPTGGNSDDDIYENNGSCGTPAQGSECLESFDITSADKIVSLCTATTGAQTCMTNSGTVHVVFRRPTPDAEICILGTNCATDLQSYLYITLQSAKGVQRVVKIYETGQISVD